MCFPSFQNSEIVLAVVLGSLFISYVRYDVTVIAILHKSVMRTNKAGADIMPCAVICLIMSNFMFYCCDYNEGQLVQC
jgi:hypothetical protein